MWIMGRKEDRVIPLEAIFQRVRPGSRRMFGPYVQGVTFPGAMIETAQIAIVVAPIDDIRIEGVRDDITAFETCRRLPVLIGDAGPGGPAFNADARVILLRSQNVEGKCVVGVDPVDLRGGL